VSGEGIGAKTDQPRTLAASFEHRRAGSEVEATKRPLVLERKLTLRNKHGFHVRSATRFVQLVNKFSAEITVEKDGVCQDGRSVLGMLMLLAGRGATIVVRASGPDAEEAVAAIEGLVEAGFGEDD